MRTFFVLAIAFVLSFSYINAEEIETADGLIKIENNTLVFRGYVLYLTKEIKEGVFMYSDGGVTAVVDYRDGEGLYIEFKEDGKLMQVVTKK